MRARHIVVTLIIIGVLASLGFAIAHYAGMPIVLDPSGEIAIAQRDLFIFALIIMSLVAVPVFALLGFIAWKYRATNHSAPYRPTWENNRLLEFIWWGIPLLVVGVLSYVAWQTSHSLDPFRPITSDKPTLQIQVIALQWKWLFLYPAQSAASLNELYLPVDTPVEFSIASDAPMNSFWIPALGGQIYAMNGMQTKLHLSATQQGTYEGVSSNISGEGFADMKFKVHVVTADEFKNNLSKRVNGAAPLDSNSYAVLAQPSTVSEPVWYTVADQQLYQSVIDKYLLPHTESESYTDPMQESMNHEGMQ